MKVTIKTDNDSLVQMFAVEPKRDCPHIISDYVLKTDQTLLTLQKHIFESPCKLCGDKGENWICLVCNYIYCSRYVNAHMVEHCTQENHVIALSLADLSFWCYECESYITNFDLDKLRMKFSNVKFYPDQNLNAFCQEGGNQQIGEKIKEEQFINNEKIEKEKDITNQPNTMQFQEQGFTYVQLIQGLKTKQFNKISFLTGAKISETTGFPSTSLNQPQLQKYFKLDLEKFKNQDKMFYLEDFNTNPQPYYNIFKDFLLSDAKPTISHYFQSFLEKRKQLLISLTENIDGLELLAGLDENYLVQENGNLRKGHCIKCSTEIDINILNKYIEQGAIMKCVCGGICKPDILFYGQNIPKQSLNKIKKLRLSDLIFVMGTELNEDPFDYYIQYLVKRAPLVIINELYFDLIKLQQKKT